MKFSVLTLFPEMFESVLGESIIGRALKKGIIETEYINIRDFSEGNYRRVDDYPYGAGGGMVMQPGPIYKAYKSVAGDNKPYVIYMSPQGNVFTQEKAKELSKMEHVVLLCGHYEGVDERIIEEIVDEEISVGDYVLTGGELPAMIVIDATSRMCEGVLDSDETMEVESHYNSLLEYPQYTRPVEFMGRRVPDVLLSGNHKKIAEWRLEKAEEITRERRPDLYEKYAERKAAAEAEKEAKKRRRRMYAERARKEKEKEK